jgi:prepilin-type processing-associated H-X9-DG protein
MPAGNIMDWREAILLYLKDAMLFVCPSRAEQHSVPDALPDGKAYDKGTALENAQAKHYAWINCYRPLMPPANMQGWTNQPPYRLSAITDPSRTAILTEYGSTRAAEAPAPCGWHHTIMYRCFVGYPVDYFYWWPGGGKKEGEAWDIAPQAKEVHNRGGNLGYADGHAAWMSHDRWVKLFLTLYDGSNFGLDNSGDADDVTVRAGADYAEAWHLSMAYAAGWFTGNDTYPQPGS